MRIAFGLSATGFMDVGMQSCGGSVCTTAKVCSFVYMSAALIQIDCQCVLRQSSSAVCALIVQTGSKPSNHVGCLEDQPFGQSIPASFTNLHFQRPRY